jgi:predicted enzyme related to lactoylglutathione lyase
MPKAQEDRGIPSHWKTYVTVDNVEETITKAKKLGAEIVLHL